MYQKNYKKKNEDIVFGFRPVIEALESGKVIDRVLLKNGLQGELYREVFDVINKKKIPFQFVPLEKLNNVTRKNHQGIIAYISPIEFSDIDNVIPGLYENGKVPFILVLDQITDVRNFGSIVRTAECAGIHAIIIPLKNAAKINADAVKTSAGAIFNMNICRTVSLKKTTDILKKSGLQVVAASEKSTKKYSQIDYTIPTVIIMGSEEKGISAELLELADETVQIPVLGKTGSLNVSNAAAIISYEVVRQRML